MIVVLVFPSSAYFNPSTNLDIVNIWGFSYTPFDISLMILPRFMSDLLMEIPYALVLGSEDENL